MSGGEGKVVGVTGASGYIASWVVKLLLERGYTVKASVRDPNDPKKTEHLRSLDGAQERLQLFAANLLEDGSFDAIVDGCVGVFHTASPVLLSVNDPKADLLDPAIKGTLNVLQSSAKVPTIKRVIVTSSLASVAYSRELKTDAVVDETWFSDPSYCEERKMWYPLSKTLAENAAWRFAKEHGIDMITINPGFVIGPHLQPTLSSSVQFFLELVNGVVPFPNTTFRWVDVRDVAYAHVLAFETPSASGRYCLVGRTAHALETLDILRQLYPTHKFPDEFSDNSTLIFPHHTISNEKAKGLGIEFTPLETSLRDAIECFKKENLVSP